MASSIKPQINEDSPVSPPVKEMQIALNDAARTITGLRRQDHVKIADLMGRANLASINQRAIIATSMEMWKAFNSTDGPDGSRNTFGDLAFPSSKPTRTSRATTAGIVARPLAKPASTLADYGIDIWNRHPTLRMATTRREAKTAARQITKLYPLFASGGLGEGSYNRLFGTYIGRLRAYSQGISGQVYVVDEQHLFISNFRYEKTGPDAHFWVGDGAQPSPRGHVVPYPPPVPEDDFLSMSGGSSLQEQRDQFNRINGITPNNRARYQGQLRPGNNHYQTPPGSGRYQTPPIPTRGAPRGDLGTQESPVLPRMNNENVLLKLPGSLKVTDIRWLSIWCRRFTVNYGEVYFPSKFTVPKAIMLNNFPINRETLSSGRVRILDTESFFIPNFRLRLTEPGYHFWVGRSNNGPNNEGMRVPDEKARYDDLKVYNNQDIIITLPKSTNMFEINYLAIYNENLRQDLGHIEFNASNSRIPPALGQTKKPGWWFSMPLPPQVQKPKPTYGQENDVITFNQDLEFPNCRELLGRKIRLLWINEGGNIYFRIKVHMDSKQFAALGIAARGSPNIDADIVKIFFNDSANRFVTEDSFLAKQLLCDFSNGLCADTAHQSQDNIRYMGSIKNHGLSIIDFRRSIIPGDMYDAPISLDGPTQVIVAIGSLHGANSAFGMNRNMNMEMENTTINFSQDENLCPDVTNVRKFEEPDPEEAWEKTAIRGMDYLVAVLGPPGAHKGYAAITGDNPIQHSAVWWINDKLLPEVYVERSKTYYFRIQGGDDPDTPKNYHPFYITSDHGGGFYEKNPAERKLETIYAGVERIAGQEVPTGVGPLCLYTSRGADKASESETFMDYRDTLRKACEPGRDYEYGWVNWTVRLDTPDLVYYQSYTGWKMGWKIHVVNEGEVSSADRLALTAGLLRALFVW
eukprot:maker-scaffold598_size127767-snap-gene-0.16 protein:Tk06476 transcript:maker-scaffold598_size127767-snap-gene-0.16-mRNA-1 annotation:"conserved hypothetical protein"